MNQCEATSVAEVVGISGLFSGDDGIVEIAVPTLTS